VLVGSLPPAPGGCKGGDLTGSSSLSVTCVLSPDPTRGVLCAQPGVLTHVLAGQSNGVGHHTGLYSALLTCWERQQHLCFKQLPDTLLWCPVPCRCNLKHSPGLTAQRSTARQTHT
jgi:hypothetical protein